MSEFSKRLQELRDSGLYRQLRLIEGAQGPSVLLNGRPVLLMCSNNYLGLANHPKLIEASRAATLELGTSAGASRLVSGNMSLHEELESALAAFVGSESALLFGSGYLMNSGVIPALAPQDSVIFSDQLNHASIIDGCRLAKADLFIYRHCDLEHLREGLAKSKGRASLIVTDAVFSMDGDRAPLCEIVQLAEEFGARVMVDEAHAIGAVGPEGRGLTAELGLNKRVDLIAGTLGKAFASYGAFVCCSSEMRDFLINRARSLIFSTGLPPANTAASLAAVQLVADEPQLVERLQNNAALFKQQLSVGGVELGESTTQIVPLIVGESDSALKLCEELLEKGIFAQAIRPPTVPEGTARLRMTPMASHSEEELIRAADVITETVRHSNANTKCHPEAAGRGIWADPSLRSG